MTNSRKVLLAAFIRSSLHTSLHYICMLIIAKPINAEALFCYIYSIFFIASIFFPFVLFRMSHSEKAGCRENRKTLENEKSQTNCN